MKYKLEPDQRQIIVRWLKEGYLDNTQLFRLENQHPFPTQEECAFQSERLAGIFFGEYCIQMKEMGKCSLYNQCKERK